MDRDLSRVVTHLLETIRWTDEGLSELEEHNSVLHLANDARMHLALVDEKVRKIIDRLADNETPEEHPD